MSDTTIPIPLVMCFPTSDLASRISAANKRVYVETLAVFISPIMFDMCKVKSISYCYADELFGVLMLKYGPEWWMKNVRLCNTTRHMSETIAKCVWTRYEEWKEKNNVA